MSSQNRILIAEDDEGVRGAIRRALEQEGYQVTVAEDGARALEISENMTPDLYLLDVMMPKVDGLSVCRTLRQRGDTTPIIVVTARHLVSDRVAGLDAGADDYLVKPFALDELLARVRALLRRGTIGASGGILEVAGIRLDQGAREVSRNGVSVQLTKTEFDLLELLMHNTGIVLTRETMFYTLDELLSAGEKDTIECKSSMYFSAKSKTPPTVVNHEIIRAIVGMLNAKGGTLLIGVSEDKDSKNYIKKGIKGDFEWMEYGEQDPKWLKRMGPLTPTWEDYQKVLRKEIMDRIGRTYFNSCIVINFEDIGFGKDNPVARVDIEPAPQPASDRSGNRHIRFANGTQLLPSDQENEYFKNRFPNLENIERDVNKL